MSLELIRNFIPLIVAVIGLVTMIVKGEKDKLKKIAGEMVLVAADEYLELTGAEKFIKVTTEVWNAMPVWLRSFISLKKIEKYVELEYQRLKAYIKMKKDGKETAKNLALLAIDETIKTAKQKKYNGTSPHLVSNKQLDGIKKDMDRVYGEVQLNTNFKKDTNLAAVLGFQKSI